MASARKEKGAITVEVTGKRVTGRKNTRNSESRFLYGGGIRKKDVTYVQDFSGSGEEPGRKGTFQG